jgi:Zn-dependent oligopeptidase
MKSSLPQFSKITDEKTKEACKDVLVEYTGQLDELVEHIQKVKEELVEKLNEFTEGKPAAAVAKRGRPRKKVK